VDIKNYLVRIYVKFKEIDINLSIQIMYLQLEMTNKFISVVIVRTCPRFDGKSPH